MRNLPKQKVASACKNNRIMKANIENSWVATKIFASDT
jgi:hypothetical protein